MMMQRGEVTCSAAVRRWNKHSVHGRFHVGTRSCGCAGEADRPISNLESIFHARAAYLWTMWLSPAHLAMSRLNQDMALNHIALGAQVALHALFLFEMGRAMLALFSRMVAGSCTPTTSTVGGIADAFLHPAHRRCGATPGFFFLTVLHAQAQSPLVSRQWTNAPGPWGRGSGSTMITPLLLGARRRACVCVGMVSFRSYRETRGQRDLLAKWADTTPPHKSRHDDCMSRSPHELGRTGQAGVWVVLSGTAAE